MARTREYYAAIGCTAPYRRAHYAAAPFAKPTTSTAVLVPNCPVGHQTISLVARHLNTNALSPDELARLRREFDAQKEIARGLRESAA